MNRQSTGHFEGNENYTVSSYNGRYMSFHRMCNTKNEPKSKLQTLSNNV